MKIKIILCFLCLVSLSHAQDKTNLNASNYYDYYVDFPQLKAKGIQGKSITTNWIKINEVVPVIMDELKSAGYEWLYDNKLFKINEKQYIVISAYSRKSNFGFLYIQGHAANPLKKHRFELTQKETSGVDYISCEETTSGQPNFIKIDKLPENIFVLNENCYWYQYTDNTSDQKILFSKDDAIKILKEDIRVYLAKAPKPIK